MVSLSNNRSRLVCAIFCILWGPIGCQQTSPPIGGNPIGGKPVDSKTADSKTVDVKPAGEWVAIESKLPIPNVAIVAEKPAPANAQVVSLKVNISGFNNSGGTCLVAVYFGPSHFNDPEYAIAKETIEIHELEASLQLELLVPPVQENNKLSNRLAISAYHDQNSNSRLDKNTFGIPTERYGFSQNP